MIKKLTIIFLLLILIGCQTTNKVGNGIENEITLKRFEVGGENVFVGGTDLQLGAEIDMDAQIFKPEVKLEKWGDETWIRVWSDEQGDDKARYIDGKVIWENLDKSREYNFYEVDNGFEYEIILKSKPKTNVITLNIESQGLKFYYQPPLNEEIKPENYWEDNLTNCTKTTCYRDKEIIIYRPEKVVGSYVVYHSTKIPFYDNKKDAQKYKMGIAFQINSPEIIDSNGWKVWGKLNIDEQKGELTVILPQEFIDNAVYPIKKAAGLRFGFETVGGTAHASADRKRFNDDYSPAQNGNLDSVSVYCAVTGNANVATAVYKANWDLVDGSTNDGSCPGVADWVTLNVDAGAAVDTGTTYAPTGWVDGSNYYYNAYANRYWFEATPYPVGTYDITDWGDPLSPTESSLSRQYSVYATYSTAAPPVAEDLEYIRQGMIKYN